MQKKFILFLRTEPLNSVIHLLNPCIECHHTEQKNRYQNSMTISCIRIDCVLTSPFGLSATRIISYLLSDELFNEEKCRFLIDHRVKASKDEVMDSAHGYHILKEQRFKMTHAKSHIDFINKSINEIDAELFLKSRQYDTQIKQIAMVPASRNCPHCSSFRRLVLTYLPLSPTGICVSWLDLPLRITRVPTRKIYQMFQRGTIFETTALSVCSCSCKK